LPRQDFYAHATSNRALALPVVLGESGGRGVLPMRRIADTFGIRSARHVPRGMGESYAAPLQNTKFRP
jgi:hypothetical protein